MSTSQNRVVVLLLTLFTGFTLFSCSETSITADLVADAGTNSTAIPGDTVTLDGTGSTGPAGFTYEWMYKGTIPEEDISFINRTTATPSFVPTQNGIYLFTLITRHGEKSSESVVTVDVTGALEIGGILTEDLVLVNVQPDAETADYILSSDLVIPEGLSLIIGDDNVVIHAADNIGITVRGTLTNAADTKNSYKGTQLKATTGWKGILLDGGTLNLNGATISKAGSALFTGQSELASIIIDGFSPTIENLRFNTFEGSFSYDLLANVSIAGTDAVTSNIFSAEVPVKAPITFLAQFNSDYPNANPENFKYIHLVPSGMERGDGFTNGDFHFSKGNYFIDGDFRAYSPVYISGGVTIDMKINSAIVFDKNGNIGSSIEESTIRGLDGALWKGIATKESTYFTLNNTTILNAGNGKIVGGTINSPVNAALFIKGLNSGSVTNSVIENSQGFGIYLDLKADDNSFFEIKDNEFKSLLQPAVRTNVKSLGNSVKSGNSFDYSSSIAGCLIELDGELATSNMIALDDSYYLVDADISISGKNVLSVEAGTHVKFKTGRAFVTTQYNTLRVTGTADAPVIFEGEQTIMSAWDGLVLGGSYDINYLHIKNGSGKAADGVTNAANVYVTTDASTGASFTNSTIENSNGYGVAFASGAADYDFEGAVNNNTFTNLILGNVIRE